MKINQMKTNKHKMTKRKVDSSVSCISKKTPSRTSKVSKLSSLSQLDTSLGGTKISLIETACGTIECVETVGRNVQKKTSNLSSFLPRQTKSKGSKNKKRVKLRKRCILKNRVEEKQLTTTTTKHTVIKMSDCAIQRNEPDILRFVSNTKFNDSRDLSILESLISAGNEGKESTFEEDKGEKLFENNNKHNSVKESNGYYPDKTKKKKLEPPVLPEINSNKQLTNLDKTKKKKFEPPVLPEINSNKQLTKQVLNENNSPLCSISVNANGFNSVASFYELGCSKYLVLMKPLSVIYIVGTVEIQLLKGSVEVLGYNIHPENKKQLLYSLQGSSHLSLKAQSESPPVIDKRSCIDIAESLIALGLPEALSNKAAKQAKNSVLFTVAQNTDELSSTVWPQFFENHSSFPIFSNAHLFQDVSRPCHAIERKTKCLFQSNLQELDLKEFNEVQEWSSVNNDILDKDHPKVILGGGKSVGKSTLLRFLANKSLSKWKKILVLDFDLGQCEFTVPGCISVTLVEEPLLGPNYSHLKEPERSVFLGEVDVTKCPENYIEGCKSLIDYAKENHKDVPWFINTMGFTKGFGVSLACGIITYVSPTHVVQIQSMDRKLNFPSVLEPKYVNCLKHSAFDVANNTMDYRVYEVPSGSGSISKSRGISPAESRHVVILSYLSRMLNSKITNLAGVTPYMISLDKLDLLTINKHNLTKNEIAATMNGNMVALCCKIPSNNFLDCRGFGIVRAIDWQNHTIFLITPLPTVELAKVNCLVKGNVGLPDSLYFNQGQVTGHVPYLAHTSGGFTSRFAKRDFRNLPVTPRDGR